MFTWECMENRNDFQNTVCLHPVRGTLILSVPLSCPSLPLFPLCPPLPYGHHTGPCCLKTAGANVPIPPIQVGKSGRGVGNGSLFCKFFFLPQAVTPFIYQLSTLAKTVSTSVETTQLFEKLTFQKEGRAAKQALRSFPNGLSLSCCSALTSAQVCLLTWGSTSPSDCFSLTALSSRACRRLCLFPRTGKAA